MIARRRRMADFAGAATVDVEAACDALIRGVGGEVVNLSLPGRSPFRDLPDRRYRLRGTTLWAELKSPTDKLTIGQLQFLRAEYEHGQLVFAGDAPMLRALLERRPAAWREYGWECLAVIAGRGFRKERAA